MDQVSIFIFGTQNHLIPYFVGVILGLILLRIRPLPIGPKTCWLLWLSLFPLTMLLPFGSYTFKDSTEPVVEPLPSAIIFSTVRLIWSSGIFWLCYECANGRAGAIRTLLSANILQPLSRLSFAIYLAHIIPIWHHYFSIRNPVTVSVDSFVSFFLFSLSLSQCICFFFLLY